MAGQAPTFESREVDDDDTAVILYTSGTTGQPKGAELMHRNMVSNALASDALFGADADNPDTLLCVLPLFHSFGQTVIQNAGFAFGGTVVLLPRFEPGPALELMDREGVTFFDHPDNPGSPVSWHVRGDGWLSPAFNLREGHVLKKKSPLVLRYALHVHAGELDEKAAAARHRLFASSKAWEVVAAKKPWRVSLRRKA